MNIIKTEIKQKTRSLKTKWTVALEHSQYDQEYEEELAKTLQEEIDWEVMMDILKEEGYTHITMPWPTRMGVVQAQDIREWCKANLTEHFHGRGPDWLFKSEKDVSIFMLRWM